MQKRPRTRVSRRLRLSEARDLEQLQAEMRADRSLHIFVESGKGDEFARSEAWRATRRDQNRLEKLIAQSNADPSGNDQLIAEIEALRKFIVKTEQERFEAFGFLSNLPQPADSIEQLVDDAQSEIRHEQMFRLMYPNRSEERNREDANAALRRRAVAICKKYPYLSPPPLAAHKNDPQYFEAVEQWCLISQQLPEAKEAAKAFKFLSDVRLCDAAIRTTLAMWREVLRQLTVLANLHSGSWNIHFTRDARKRNGLVPVEFRFGVGDEVLNPKSRSRVEYEPRDHSPFYDFKILDMDGQAPRKNTQAHRIGLHLAYLLERLSGIVDLLHNGLQRVQNGAADRGMKNEIWALKQLAAQLPEFPFWDRYCRESGWHDDTLRQFEELCGTAQSALGRMSDTETDTDDGAPYLPASAFSYKVRARLRKATQSNRKSKQVRTKHEGGVKKYSSPDSTGHWDDCFDVVPTA